MKWHTAVFFSLLAASIAAFAEKMPIIGRLGKPVGTELTIEGAFQAGKNTWLLVTKVNGEKLASPVLVATDGLDPFAQIPTNTVCRFKGKEITYVVRPVVDPKTGQEMQQEGGGRHFAFIVTEVLAPKGVKTRDETPQAQPASR